MDDNKRRLYDALSSEYDMGTFEQFASDIKDDAKRKRLYDAVSTEYDLGDYDSFSKQLFQGEAQQIQAPTSERTPNYTATTGDYTQPTEAQRNFEERGNFEPIGQSSVELNGQDVPVLVGAQGQFRVPSPVKLDEQQEIFRHGNPSQEEVREEQSRAYRVTMQGNYAKMDEIDKSISERMGELTSRYFKEYGGTAQSDAMGEPAYMTALQSNKDFKNLRAAYNLIQDARKRDRQVRRADDGFFINTGRAAFETAADARTWDFGAIELSDATSLYEAVQKDERGEKLTDSERILLDAFGSNALAMIQNKNREQSAGELAGATTVEMIPFIAQIIANPLAKVGTAASKGAAKAVTKWLYKRLGNVASKAARKAVYTGARGATSLAVGVPADLVGGAGVAVTSNVMNTTADVYDRLLNGDSTGKAVAKGIMSQGIEFASENAGRFIAPFFGGLGKVLGRGAELGLNKIGAGKVVNLAKDYAKKAYSPAVKEFMDDTQWHGFFGEYGEEIIGGLENAALVGDMSASKVFSKDNLFDTAVGLSVSSVLFPAVATANYIGTKHEQRKEAAVAEKRARAVFGDKWPTFRAAVVGAKNSDELGMAISRIYQQEGKQVADSKEVKALYEYASKYYAYNALKGINPEKVAYMSDEYRDVADNFSAGESMAPEELQRASMEARRAFGELERLTGMAADELAGIGVEDALNRADEAEANGDMVLGELWRSYIRASANLSGNERAVKGVIEERSAASDAEVDALGNNGRVVSATLRSGEEVFVVGGNVVLNGDGSINEEASDKQLIVVLDGERKSIGIASIGSVDGSVSVDEEKAMRRAAIEEEARRQQMIDRGDVHVFTPGETFSSSMGEVQFVEDNGDGTASVTVNGSNAVVAMEELNNLYSQAKQAEYNASKRAEGAEGEKVDEESVPAEAAVPVGPAMQKIPKDVQGNPLYERADSNDAWDAIVEQAEGDVAMAQTVADGMVADKEAALNKLEKGKAKGGATVAEKIAAERERQAAIDAAKEELAKWKEIAGTAARRRLEAEAEEKRLRDEQEAARKAEEEKSRAEQEEAERKEREALNGVPDMVDDTPQDARARGYRRVSGHKVDRQEPLQALMGKEVAVKFSNNTLPTGRVAVIEAGQLQPSHIGGVRNPLHFIDEAQPKERNDEASVISAQKIAGNIRPEEITSSITAYTGAPTVNARGEAIQGNSRSDALRLMWESYPEQAAKYKQYLMDRAEEFGLRAEDIAAMERPVLVNLLDVEDAEAITLGQFVAQDTESGGTERIKPKNALQKMGDDMRSFANLLLKSSDEEASFAELVDKNGAEVLRWMSQKGYISPTQYKSAFDSKGNITAEAKNDLRGIMYQSIFKGGSTRLEEMFNALPAKAQKAILATAFRDYDSPNADRMIGEIQNSIRAYHALSQSEAFVNAKSFKDARAAVEAWKIQYQIDDVTGESYLPADNFSNFALHLATMYKGDSQSLIQGTFNKLFDLIQGTQEADLFEQPDNTPRSLAQAIKETLNITYNGQLRSNVLAGDSAAGQRGKQGSSGDAETGERTESRERNADSAGGAERGGGQSEVAPETESTDLGSASQVEEETSNSTPTLDERIAEFKELLKQLPNRDAKSLIKKIERYLSSLKAQNNSELNEEIHEWQAKLEAIKELLQERDNGSWKTDFGVKLSYSKELSIEEVKTIFEHANSDKAVAVLFDKVYNVAKTLGLKIKVSDQLSAATGNAGNDGMVKYGAALFYRSDIDNQAKAGTLLHELIHTCTMYATTLYRTRGIGGMFTEMYEALPQEIKNACVELNRIFELVKDNKELIGEYGIASVDEMVAELSNVEFRDKMKKVGLWERLVNAIKRLFDFPIKTESEQRATDALSEAERVLVTMLENFDRDSYNEIRAKIQSAGRGRKRKIAPQAELQRGSLSLDTENPAFEAATKNTIEAVKKAGVEIEEATPEMVEAVLGAADVEKMAVSEARKRANEIKSITAFPVISTKHTKAELIKIYQELKPVEKEGELIEFFHGVFGKAWHGEDSMFAKIVPYLREIFEDSKLAYSETDVLGGLIRRDGTKHKEHPNIVAYHNFVGKTNIDGTEYYVRFTVQEEKSGKQGTHSFFVSEVALYENPHEDVTTDTKNHLGKTSNAGIVDAKLKNFFDFANGKLNIPEFHRVYHGSGAKFDKFDHSFMGTGEGGRVAGAGIYVTTKKEVGISYAEFVGKNGGEGRYLYSVEIPDDNGSNYIDLDGRVSDSLKSKAKEKVFEFLFNSEDADYWKKNKRIIEQEWKAVEKGDATGYTLRATMEELIGDSEIVSDIFSSLGFVGFKTNEDAPSGTTYVIFNENDAQITDRVEFLRTSDGTVYGWSVGGRIYLAPEGMNPNTPAHEYTHLWSAMVEKNDPKLWSRIVEVMKESPTWNEVLLDEAYRDIHNNDSRMASEVLSRLSGEENYRRAMELAEREIKAADGIIEKAKKIALWGRIKQALADFWASVKGVFGFKDKAPWMEFVNMSLGDLYAGVNPNAVGSPLERMFIGERGAANLDMAEEASLRLDNLNVAREMEEAGKGAKAIKLATGWERGADGKWRYEVMDDFAFDMSGNVDYGKRKPESLKEYNRYKELLHKKNALAFEGEELPADELAEFKGLEVVWRGTKLHNSERLKDFIDAPELFEAYPELRNVAVRFDDLGDNVFGQYSAASNEITINPNHNEVAIKSALAHEIQHAIQYIEGFAKGGNTESVRTKAQELRRDVAPLYEMMLDTPEWAEKQRLQKRWFDETDDAKIAEIEARVEEIDNSGVLKGIEALQAELQKKYGLDRTVGWIISSPYAEDAEIWNELPDSFNDRFEAYRSLAGEVEARNVQSRMGMTEEERRNSLAVETEDVAREDQIFIEENLGVSKMGSRVDKRMADVAEQLKDRELTPEQQAVVDVFSGKSDNLPISVKTQGGNVRKIVMRQGNEAKAGAKHSLYRHYGTGVGSITSEDIALIPHVLENGVRSEDGKKIVYELEKDGTVYKIITEKNSRGAEVFDNFYTNKNGNARSSNTQLSAQADSNTASADKDTENISNAQEEDTSFRPGEGAYSDEEVAFENDPISKVLGKPRGTKAQRREFAEREAVDDVASALNTPIEVLESTEGLTGRLAKAKGWYEKSTGRIVVVLPNNKSVADVMQTVLHEAVAHYGLRKLFGEHFDDFIDNIYNNVDAETRRKINLLASRNGWNLKVATEEYLASLAEDANFERVNPSLWKRIKSFFLDMLAKAGVRLDFELTDDELRYILWRSYQNLKNPGRYRTIAEEARDIAMQSRLKVGNYAENALSDVNVAEDDILMRSPGQSVAQTLYDKETAGFVNDFVEGWQNRYRSLQALMNAIEKETGKKIADFANVFLNMEHLPARNRVKMDSAMRKYVEPLMAIVNDFAKMGVSQKELERYLNSKHGLERNREMAVADACKSVDADGKAVFDSNKFSTWEAGRDAIYAQGMSWADTEAALDALAKTFGVSLNKDYSGLTAIYKSSQNGVSRRKAAYDAVVAFESKAGNELIDELWKRVKAINDFSLSESFSSGLMAKDTYDRLTKRYRYYVPLRGFNEKAVTEYEYVSSTDFPMQGINKTAHGRRSEAADIFPTMMNMMESAVVLGNRNRAKLALLHLAEQYPTKLLTVSNSWYSYNDVNDTWVPVAHPQLTPNMTPEEIADTVNKWETDMRELEKQGKAKRFSTSLQIDKLGLESWKQDEHSVKVRRNGKEYVVWVNGNPKAAQAINGILGVQSQDTSKFFQLSERANRWRANNITSRNPEFVFSNLARDVQQASKVSFIKFGFKYLRDFERNLWRNSIPNIHRLYYLYSKDKLNMNNPTHKMFYEFMQAGSETGFITVMSIEDYQKKIDKLVSPTALDKAGKPIEVVRDVFNTATEFANRGVENACRFAAFMTSRQAGRSLLESVNDAKEVSLNFDRKGSGAYGNMEARQMKMFLNPTIQGLAQQITLIKEYPARAIPVTMAELAMGYFAGQAAVYLFNWIASLFTGDDDEKYNYSYYNIPEFVRRNSLIIPTGREINDYIVIPLSHEQRVAYGIGEILGAFKSGHMDAEDVPTAIMAQAAQMLPMNPFDAEAFIDPNRSAWENFIKTVSPDILVPGLEAVFFNENFAGMRITNQSDYNKHLPEYKRALKDTPKYMVELSKFINEASGGTSGKKGWADSPYTNNPAVWEHLMKSYLGGIYAVPNKATKTVLGFWDEDFREPKNWPIIGKFYMDTSSYEQSPEERTRRDYENAYYKIKDKYEAVAKELTTYRKELVSTDEEVANEARKNLETAEGSIYNSRFVGYFKSVEKMEKQLKDALNEAKESKKKELVDELEQRLLLLKKEAVNYVETLEELNRQ